MQQQPEVEASEPFAFSDAECDRSGKVTKLQKQPFAPRLGLLFACALGVGVTVLPATTQSFFREAISNDVGWSISRMSLAYTLYVLVLILALPLAGRIADRVDTRRFTLASLAAFGVTVALSGFFITSVAGYFASFVLLGLFGAGASAVVFARFVTMAFPDRLGTALGLTFAGFGLGTGIFPPLTQYIIDEHGWRSAYLGLGATVLLIVLPIQIFFLKEAPRAATNPATRTQNEPVSEGISRPEAVRTLHFWQLSLVMLLFGLALTGVTANLVTLLKDEGISPMEVGKMFTFMGFASIGGRIVGGWLLDRIPAQIVGGSIGTLGALALLGFMLAGEYEAAAMVCSTLLGFSYGGESDIASYLCRRYFGRRSFSEIYGFQLSSYYLGSAIGPVLVALMIEHDVSSRNILMAVVAVYMVVITLIFTLKRPPALTHFK